MKSNRRTGVHGFSLLEMMLVMVVVASMIWMGVGYMQTRTRSLQIDRASAQMQQILNAGLSYYVNEGKWPANIAALQGSYLPATVISPWATSYTVTPDSTNSILTVSVSLPSGYANSNAIGQILAGKLPFGVSTNAVPPAGTSVSASVNIPAQNLNNIGNVNFAQIYHSGACVPAPTCPATSGGATFTPQIVVTPVSVTGTSTAGVAEAYPIVSLTAKAKGEGTTDDPADFDAGSLGPTACGNDTSGASTSCFGSQDVTTGVQSDPINTGKYWRVCLYATTAQGDITWDVTTGTYATVMAITRCAPSTQDIGSSFDVWGH